MSYLADADLDLVLNILASSDGDLPLACERLTKSLGLNRGDILEYELKERVAALDIQSTDTLSSKFRALLIVRLYNLVIQATSDLALVLGDLKPAELARTHASLVNSFATLTAPSTKVTFDFDRELQDISREFGLPMDDLRGEIKEMDSKIKLKMVK